jgi:hypothetical protein
VTPPERKSSEERSAESEVFILRATKSRADAASTMEIASKSLEGGNRRFKIGNIFSKYRIAAHLV